MNDPISTAREFQDLGGVAQAAKPHPTRFAWFRAIYRWRPLANAGTRLVCESTALVLAIILAAGWFSAPYFVRDYINRSLSGLPDYTGRVEGVRIHPWSASLDIYDMHLDKKTGEIPVHFFYSPRTSISLQWSQIFHGVDRASITIFDPQINLVAGSTPGQSQFYISKVWLDAIKELIPWRVNQVTIHRGIVHYRDFHADPQIDLQVDQFELVANNMSNSQGLKVPLPATVRITARPLLTGTLEMNLAVNFDAQFATFTQDIRVEHVPAVGANSVAQKYLNLRVESGEIGLYSELASDKGIYHGYVKAFFYHLKFEPKTSDEGNPKSAWAGLLNTVKGLFENDRGVIASQSRLSGRVDQPNVDTLSVIAGVLRNAFIEALRPGFDPMHSPVTPSDTGAEPSSVGR